MKTLKQLLEAWPGTPGGYQPGQSNKSSSGGSKTTTSGGVIHKGKKYSGDEEGAEKAMAPTEKRGRGRPKGSHAPKQTHASGKLYADSGNVKGHNSNNPEIRKVAREATALRKEHASLSSGHPKRDQIKKKLHPLLNKLAKLHAANTEGRKIKFDASKYHVESVEFETEEFDYDHGAFVYATLEEFDDSEIEQFIMEMDEESFAALEEYVSIDEMDQLSSRAGLGLSAPGFNKTPAGKNRERERNKEHLKFIMKATKRLGGIAGPKGKLPEEVEVAEETELEEVSSNVALRAYQAAGVKAMKEPTYDKFKARSDQRQRFLNKFQEKSKKERDSSMKEETELDEAVKTDNEGRGYHGEHPSDKADAAYSKMHATVKKVAGEAGHMRDVKNPNVMVKHYLDSVHGRHLAGKEGNHEYIAKDFKKFKRYYDAKQFATESKEVDSIEELSSDMLKSYHKKAVDQLVSQDTAHKKYDRRLVGATKAFKKFTDKKEPVTELSKKTLGSYVKAAAQDAEGAGRDQEHYGHENDYKRGRKRQQGIAKAVDRLTKEETNLVDEVVNAIKEGRGF